MVCYSPSRRVVLGVHGLVHGSEGHGPRIGIARRARRGRLGRIQDKSRLKYWYRRSSSRDLTWTTSMGRPGQARIGTGVGKIPRVSPGSSTRQRACCRCAWMIPSVGLSRSCASTQIAVPLRRLEAHRQAPATGGLVVGIILFGGWRKRQIVLAHTDRRHSHLSYRTEPLQPLGLPSTKPLYPLPLTPTPHRSWKCGPC